MRIVLDTNVIVSALLLPASTPRNVFDKAANNVILISTPVLFELVEVLARARFDPYVTESERMRFLVALLKETELVEPTDHIDVCRDTKDNKLLELAVSGQAGFLITGDRDLLELDPFRGVRIINPHDFLKLVD